MMGSLFTAFLAFAIVRRHTRTEEEDGRFELVAAGVVGRRAPLAAAVGLATLTVLATGLLSALSLVAHRRRPDRFVRPRRGRGRRRTRDDRHHRHRRPAHLDHPRAPAASRSARWAWPSSCAPWPTPPPAAARTSSGCRSSAGPRRSARSARTACGCSCPPSSPTAALLVVADLLLHRRDLGSGLWAARPGPARAVRRPGHPARPRVAAPARRAARLDHRVCRAWAWPWATSPSPWTRSRAARVSRRCSAR